MSHKVVIVESPAKAKTINKYLGSDYKVVASFGHIRDLPPKDGSVRPDEDFAMEWAMSDRASKPVAEISKLAQDADAVYLAPDPDREGEAIAWHLQEVLRSKKALKSTPLHRITFNEITKKTVLDAIANPRDIDQNLVDAYMARRALDYLVGFSLSPVLWRKLPGSKSAGRVQSVALRLICERESEIEDFKPQEFWTIEGIFKTKKGEELPARLTHLNGKKLDKFALGNETEAKIAFNLLDKLVYNVDKIERKQTRRNPYAPFTTSTIQQEASHKLGYGATRTMRIAQKLYEGSDIGGETVGLITYMRTDGVSLSQEAIDGARDVITSDYGTKYLPEKPRIYKSKAKNAQEAHEAIRPTDMSRTPEKMKKYLDSDGLRLYTLIWQRTMASQMASAVLDQVAVDIDGEKTGTFRATGSTVTFDGWMRVYQAQKHDDEITATKGNERLLPPVKEQDPLDKDSLTDDQHFTQPPPRYSEASLVKKMEELGIGRPSTYASIMQVLQDRDYVNLDKKRFIPQDRGRVVTTFLETYFGQYVQYDFTADLEQKLDKVSDGSIEWKSVMRDFWSDFSDAVGATKDLKISDVIDALDEVLGPHFFPIAEDGTNPRTCTSCADGRMGLKLGKFGAFIGCSNYPTCKNTRPLAINGGNGKDGTPQITEPKELGLDPDTKLPVSVRVGPYGAYVQLGPLPETEVEEPAEELTKDGKKKKTKKRKPKAPKPKRTSIPKGMDTTVLDLDIALQLLALPREVGKHPETDQKITASIGRFGPYIKMGTRYKSLTDADDLLTIGLNRAVVMMAEPDKGRGAGGANAKVLGEHPDDKKPITQKSGRFGPYVQWGKVMATITKAYDPDEVTLADALDIIAAKIERAAAKGTAKKKPAAKKKAPAKKKATAKKKPAAKKKVVAKKKPAAKKTAVKKKPTAKKKAAVKK